MSDATNYNEPQKLWNKSFILILFLNTCVHATSQMVTPLISKYAVSMGAELTIAATISGTMSIVALLLRPVSGLCSDSFDRKKIIMLANILMGVCMLMYAGAGSVAALMTVRIIHGVVFSFSGVALMAFNTSFMPRDRIGEGMGWMAMSSIVAQALGPNLGMWMVERYSYSACFILAACICCGGVLILSLVPYSHVRPTATRRIDLNSLISLRILPYAVLMGLFSCGNGLVNTFIALIGDERGIADIGLFFTAYSVCMVAIRPFTGKLLDRKGLKIILYPAYIIAAASMLLMGYANALWMVVLAGALKALGQGAGSPSIQAHCMKQLGREKSGVVSSTCYIGQDIGNAIAPILGGMVVERYGYSNLFLGYAILLVIAGWGLYYIKSKYDEKKYGTV